MGPSDFHGARGWPLQTPSVGGRDPPPRHGSRTLPQRPSAHADFTTPAGRGGFSGRLLPRPPTAFPLREEGRRQRETIGACSKFRSSFGLRSCTLGSPRDSPEAPAGRLLAPTAPVATGAYRQFPGRDSHPRAFETQEVSPSAITQLTSDLLSCRTAGRFAPGTSADRPATFGTLIR